MEKRVRLRIICAPGLLLLRCRCCGDIDLSQMRLAFLDNKGVIR